MHLLHAFKTHSGRFDYERSVITRNMILNTVLNLITHFPNSPFLSIINTAWISFFIDKALHPATVCIALKIITSLYQSKSSDFGSKFRGSQGFKILEQILPEFYESEELYFILLCLMLGKPVTSINPNFQLNLQSLCSISSSFVVSSSTSISLSCPEALQIFIAILNKNIEMKSSSILRIRNPRKNTNEDFDSSNTELQLIARSDSSRINNNENEYLTFKSIQNFDQVHNELLSFLFFLLENSLDLNQLIWQSNETHNFLEYFTGLLFPGGTLYGVQRLSDLNEDNNYDSEQSETTTLSQSEQQEEEMLKSKKNFLSSKNNLNSNLTKKNSSNFENVNSENFFWENLNSKIKNPFCFIYKTLFLIIEKSMKGYAKSSELMLQIFEATPQNISEAEFLKFEETILKIIVEILPKKIEKHSFLQNQMIQTNIARVSCTLVDRVLQNLIPARSGSTMILLFLLEILQNFGILQICQSNLEQLKKPLVPNFKEVVQALYRSLYRIVLFRLSEHSMNRTSEEKAEHFGDLIKFSEMMLNSPMFYIYGAWGLNFDKEFLYCIVYQAYLFLLSDSERLRNSVMEVFKLLLTVKPEIMDAILIQKNLPTSKTSSERSGISTLVKEGSFAFTSSISGSGGNAGNETGMEGKQGTGAMAFVGAVVSGAFVNSGVAGAVGVQMNESGKEDIDLKSGGFDLLLMDTLRFSFWVVDHISIIQKIFEATLSKYWEMYESGEKRSRNEGFKQLKRRRDAKMERQNKEIRVSSIHLNKIQSNKNKTSANIQENAILSFRQRRRARFNNVIQVRLSWLHVSECLKLEKQIFGPSKPSVLSRWRLDESECNGRMRLKLQRNYGFYLDYRNVNLQLCERFPTSEYSRMYYDMFGIEYPVLRDELDETFKGIEVIKQEDEKETKEEEEMKGEIETEQRKEQVNEELVMQLMSRIKDENESGLLSPVNDRNNNNKMIRKSNSGVNSRRTSIEGDQSRKLDQFLSDITPRMSIDVDSRLNNSNSVAATNTSTSTTNSSTSTPTKEGNQTKASLSSSLERKESFAGLGTLVENDIAFGEIEKRIEREDKTKQLIERILEKNDELYSIFNCQRIVGMDPICAILLLSKHCIYIVDDYYLLSGTSLKDYEICEIDSVPFDTMFISSSQHKNTKKPNVNQSKNHQNLNKNSSISLDKIVNYDPYPCLGGITLPAALNSMSSSYQTLKAGHFVHQWPYENIQQCLIRRYLLLPIGIEIFLSGGITEMIVVSETDVEQIYKFLNTQISSFSTNQTYLSHFFGVFQGNSNSGTTDLLAAASLATRGGVDSNKEDKDSKSQDSSNPNNTNSNQSTTNNTTLNPVGVVGGVAQNLTAVHFLERSETLLKLQSSFYTNLGLQNTGLNKKSSILYKWQNGEITNFQYLMYLNTLAGRSYNDLHQYPVFPWILNDYSSDTISLSDETVFRDLSKPMGALNPRRAVKFQERFDNWDPAESFEDIPKWHYGTHYSSAGIVSHFLMRMEPFTSYFLKLQSGRFDKPDRLFHSINETWLSASGNGEQFSLADVRELLPEFYYNPEFLKNSNKFVFGARHTGEQLGDVILPNWCKGDASEFVRIMRNALESDYVSSHIHEWIDLIFGHKQKGIEAEKNLNVYYYLTYEGAIDIRKILSSSTVSLQELDDEEKRKEEEQKQVERESILAQINNYGQTPMQLFTDPHPPRYALVKMNTAAVNTGVPESPVLLTTTTSQALNYISPIRDAQNLTTPPGTPGAFLPVSPVKETIVATTSQFPPAPVLSFRMNSHMNDFDFFTDWSPTLVSTVPFGVSSLTCPNSSTLLPLPSYCVSLPPPSLSTAPTPAIFRSMIHSPAKSFICFSASMITLPSPLTHIPIPPLFIPLTSIAVPDHLKMLFLYSKTLIGVFDVNTNKISHILRGHKHKITCVRIINSWNRLISGDESGRVFIHDLNNLQFIKETKLNGSILGIRIEEEKGEAGIWSNLGEILIIDGNGELKGKGKTIGVTAIVGAGGNGGVWVTVGGPGGKVKVWCEDRGRKGELKMVKEWEGFGGGAKVLAMCWGVQKKKKKRRMYVGDDNGRVWVWCDDWEKKNVMKELNHPTGSGTGEGGDVSGDPEAKKKKNDLMIVVPQLPKLKL